MSKITRIHAREVLDSRGNPTVQVEVETEAGGYGLAMSPSGASTGALEAHELRDKGTKYEKNWYGGKGVQTAVDNVNNIIAKEILKLEDLCVTEQRRIDEMMIKLDGTRNKAKLGANAILAVSLAVAKAAACETGMSLYKYIGGTNARKLPMPMLNVINGGAHASNTLDFQEFMIMPVGAKTFKEAMQMANKVFHTLHKLFHDAGHMTQVGDEGGFAPNLKSHEEALDYLVQAIEKAGYKPARSGANAVAIAMDPATSEIYDGKKYVFKKLEAAIKSKQPGFDKIKSKTQFTREEMIEYWGGLFKKYPIVSLEDGMAESDWEGFKMLCQKYGKEIQIMGDDLTVTNQAILAYAIKERAINSILIKVNQIGSLSETLDTIELAHKAGMTAVVSHRSGETEDTTIADLAVAYNTGQIKTGSMSRTDRIAKYNRLLAIEEELGSTAVFEGVKVFHNLGKNVEDAKKPSLEGAEKHQ